MKKSILSICLLFAVTGCATGSFPTPQQLATERFTECPPDYKEQIKNQLSRGLFDPYSAVFSFGPPEKYVYEGKFGCRVLATVNAKNRFGAYVGEQVHMFMCFPDGSVREINEFLTGMANGLRK